MRRCVSSSNKGEQDSHARQRRTSLQSVRKRTRQGYERQQLHTGSAPLDTLLNQSLAQRCGDPGVLRSFFKQRRSSPQPRSGVLLRSSSRRQQALQDCTPGHCPNVVIASGAVAYLHHADAKLHASCWHLGAPETHVKRLLRRMKHALLLTLQEESVLNGTIM